ncbi:hypothetical protein BX257_6635 [Streptomyces sp. 3212.3]|nr:hypothetical protein BX257_6635 [Streptomyces sp. 3212.3]
MASVVPRKNKVGAIISYQVKWRLGGGRDAPWQTERFDDVDSAEIFKTAVNEHGQQWPPGWVRGRGFISPLVLQSDFAILCWVGCERVRPPRDHRELCGLLKIVRWPWAIA